MREFGSEYSLDCDFQNTFVDYKKGKSDIFFLRTGRDALTLCASDIKLKNGVMKKHAILVPTLSCESMILPFQKEKFEIIFYKVEQNLTIDFQHIMYLLEKYEIDAILVMHYFRYIDFTEFYRNIKEKEHLNIIEDITQCLFEKDIPIVNEVDYRVGSIRKWIGIADGALAIKNDAKFLYQPSYGTTYFTQIRKLCLTQKYKYYLTNDEQLKKTFRNNFSMAESSLVYGDCYFADKDSVQKILSHNTNSLEFSRRKNFEHLKYNLSKEKNIKLFDFKSIFMLPILSIGKNRNAIQNELAILGVYTQVLWPISEKAKEVDAFAKDYCENMLALPIDQRYCYQDIEDITAIINEVLRK